MEYYIADLHFCHKNIPKFEPTRTQFIDNVDLMNETIINNWNAVVTDEDIVNIIGDVGIGAQASIVKCVKRLNGKLRLWPGNHDHGNLLKKLQSEAGVEVMPYMTKVKTHGVVVFVTHYPMDIGERPNLFNIMDIFIVNRVVCAIRLMWASIRIGDCHLANQFQRRRLRSVF